MHDTHPGRSHAPHRCRIGRARRRRRRLGRRTAGRGGRRRSDHRQGHQRRDGQEGRSRPEGPQAAQRARPPGPARSTGCPGPRRALRARPAYLARPAATHRPTALRSSWAGSPTRAGSISVLSGRPSALSETAVCDNPGIDAVEMPMPRTSVILNFTATRTVTSDEDAFPVFQTNSGGYVLHHRRRDDQRAPLRPCWSRAASSCTSSSPRTAPWREGCSSRTRRGPPQPSLKSSSTRPPRTPSEASRSGRPQPASGARLTGQLMQRGPPRPEPSSEPAIRTTSMPASSRRLLVSSLRS